MYNPLVTGAPSIRFYAGAPLVTSNGMRLGSLCVIDTEPRHLDAEQLMVLANFAEVVVREIEKDMARVRDSKPLACAHKFPLVLCSVALVAGTLTRLVSGSACCLCPCEDDCDACYPLPEDSGCAYIVLLCPCPPRRLA